jgi:hypothetical protein
MPHLVGAREHYGPHVGAILRHLRARQLAVCCSDPREFRHRSTGLGVGSAGLGLGSTGWRLRTAGLGPCSTGSRLRSTGLGVGSTGLRLRSAGFASSEHGVASRQRRVAFSPRLGGFRARFRGGTDRVHGVFSGSREAHAAAHRAPHRHADAHPVTGRRRLWRRGPVGEGFEGEAVAVVQGAGGA